MANKRIFGWLVGVAVWWLPASAWALADTCTVTGPGVAEWNAVGTLNTVSGVITITCVGGDNAPPIDADDDVIFATDVDVRVTGDITQNAGARGVHVNGGGIFNATVADDGNPATSDAIILTLGSKGLDCDLAATCIVRGAFRQWGTNNPILQTEYSYAAHTVWQIGNVIPCPDASSPVKPDCTGNQNIIRITYPNPPYNTWIAGEVGDAEIDQSINHVIANEDMIVWLDPDTTDTIVPVDSPYAYTITAKGSTCTAGNTCYIQADIRQGTLNMTGYPLARRDVVQTTLATPVAKGDKTITLVPNSLPSPGVANRQSLVARWIRFENASLAPCNTVSPICSPQNKAYKIERSLDSAVGVNDTVTIQDPLGVSQPFAAGGTVWIDYGWQDGDTFAVVAPVIIRSASAVEANYPVHSLLGNISLNGVVFDKLAKVDLNGADLREMNLVWARDWGDGSASASVFDFKNLTNPAVVRNVTCTGGTATATNGIGHCFPINGGTNVVLEDFGARYMLDDCTGVTGTLTTHPTWRRFRCGPVADNALSTNCIDMSTLANTNFVVDGFLCEDGTFDATTGQGSIAINAQTNSTGYFKGFTYFGPTGSVGVVTAQTPLIDYEAIGGTVFSLTSGHLIPRFVDRFVVRDTLIQISGLTLLNGAGSVKNGYVRDITYMADNNPFRFVPVVTDNLFENVAILNINKTTAVSTNVMSNDNTFDTETLTLRNITLAWPPGTDVLYSVAFNRDAVGPTNVIFDGFLVANMRNAANTAGTAYFANGANLATFGDGPCFYNNWKDAGGPGPTPAIFPTTTVRGQNLGFVDPPRYRFDTRAGGAADVAACGILGGGKAPGIHVPGWSQYINRLGSETGSGPQDGSGGGGGGSPPSAR